MRSDRARLLDALEQIGLIQQFAAAGPQKFRDDVLVQSAILHRLTLLGEACRTISADLRTAHPEVPWAQIAGFRNIVIHEYFALDVDLVWRVIADHVELLRVSLSQIVTDLPLE